MYVNLILHPFTCFIRIIEERFGDLNKKHKMLCLMTETGFVLFSAVLYYHHTRMTHYKAFHWYINISSSIMSLNIISQWHCIILQFNQKKIALDVTFQLVTDSNKEDHFVIYILTSFGHEWNRFTSAGFHKCFKGIRVVNISQIFKTAK